MRWVWWKAVGRAVWSSMRSGVVIELTESVTGWKGVSSPIMWVKSKCRGMGIHESVQNGYSEKIEEEA